GCGADETRRAVALDRVTASLACSTGPAVRIVVSSAFTETPLPELDSGCRSRRIASRHILRRSRTPLPPLPPRPGPPNPCSPPNPTARQSTPRSRCGLRRLVVDRVRAEIAVRARLADHAARRSVSLGSGWGGRGDRRSRRGCSRRNFFGIARGEYLRLRLVETGFQIVRNLHFSPRFPARRSRSCR